MFKLNLGENMELTKQADRMIKSSRARKSTYGWYYNQTRF